ncbi:hypothetical protein GCM10022397_26860 [Flavivirga jejuensis]
MCVFTKYKEFIYFNIPEKTPIPTIEKLKVDKYFFISSFKSKYENAIKVKIGIRKIIKKECLL